jgi:hypothetical protein
MRWTRALAFVPLLAAIATLAACDDNPTDDDDDGDDPAEAIATMRITIGAITIFMTPEGTIPSGPTSFTVGGGVHIVSAAFLDANGQVVTGLGDFEFRLTPTNTSLVTFARTGPFSGTLTRVAPGTTTLRVGLFHTGEGHFDIGEHQIPITVQ